MARFLFNGHFFGSLNVTALVSTLLLFKTAPKHNTTRKVVLKMVRFLLTYSSVNQKKRFFVPLKKPCHVMGTSTLICDSDSSYAGHHGAQRERMLSTYCRSSGERPDNSNQPTVSLQCLHDIVSHSVEENHHCGAAYSERYLGF